VHEKERKEEKKKGEERNDQIFIVFKWFGEWTVLTVTHQILLVIVVRLLGVIFMYFHQIASPKSYFGEAVRNALTQLLNHRPPSEILDIAPPAYASLSA
jgi:hypothetical protein